MITVILNKKFCDLIQDELDCSYDAAEYIYSDYIAAGETCVFTELKRTWYVYEDEEEALKYTGAESLCDILEYQCTLDYTGEIVLRY